MSLFPFANHHDKSAGQMQFHCGWALISPKRPTMLRRLQAPSVCPPQLCRVFHVAERLCVAGDRRCGLRSIGVDFSKECLDKASVRCPHRREPVTHALSGYF